MTGKPRRYNSKHADFSVPWTFDAPESSSGRRLVGDELVAVAASMGYAVSDQQFVPEEFDVNKQMHPLKRSRTKKAKSR